MCTGITLQTIEMNDDLHTLQVTERKRRAERARLQYERELEEQK